MTSPLSSSILSADVPGGIAHTMLAERYLRIFRIMLWLALASYGSYLGAFIVLKVPFMPLVNAVACVLVGLAQWAVKRRRTNLALVITAGLVLGHTVPASWILGWDAGFHLFSYLFLVFFLLEPDLGLKTKLAAVVAMAVGYLSLEWMVRSVTPQASDLARDFFDHLNGVVFWACLSFLAVLHTFAIRAVTEQLAMTNEQLRRAEQNVREIFEISPVAMVVSRLSDQTIIDGNHQAELLFEVPVPKVVGRQVLDFWQNPEQRVEFRQALIEKGKVQGFEVQLKTNSGRVFWAELSGCVLNFRGGQALLVTCSDITVRRRIAALTKESEQTVHMLLDATPLPLLVIGYEDAVIRYSNPSAAELFELPGDGLVGLSARDFFVAPEERQAFVEQLRRNGRVESFTTRLKSSTGREHWLVLSARSFELRGERVFSVGFASVAKHKALEEHLRLLASTDALTGALNRGALFEVGQAELDRLAQSGSPLSVAMIDADHFKNINDELGHQAGDQALRLLADVIRQQVRSGDLLARYGGEEFVVLLPGLPLVEATRVIERIRSAIESHPLEAEVGPRRVTVSAGVCLAHPQEKLEQAIRRADEALYAAKQGGRNRVEARPL